MKTTAYSDIYDYCRWNKVKNISTILNSNDALDLLYKEGIYFKFAFKHNNSAMLDILLSHYYHQHKLETPIQDYSFEQKKAKQELLQILEECVETYTLSEDFTKTLNNYGLDLRGDTSSIDDSEEKFEDNITIEFKGYNSQSTAHRSPESKEDLITKEMIGEYFGTLVQDHITEHHTDLSGNILPEEIHKV